MRVRVLVIAGIVSAATATMFAQAPAPAPAQGRRGGGQAAPATPAQGRGGGQTAAGAPGQGRAGGAAATPRYVPADPIDFNDHTGWTSMFDGKTLDGWDG